MANKIILRLLLNEVQAESLKAKYLKNNEHVKTLITEDTDAYDTAGNLIFRFRKNAIPFDVLKNGYECFKESIVYDSGRGAAAGESTKRIRKDGSISNIVTSAKVTSGNVGFMEQSSMIHYCRKTAFARKYFDLYKQGLPFVEYISNLYKELCPEHYESQRKIVEATDINYVVGNSVFTTVTVNKNFQTAVHKDSGDYSKGFGNLCVYREGSYEGCYFVLPEYGVGIDMQNCDMLFVDVHRFHGNTPFLNQSPDALRISFVMYYREKIKHCKKPSEELFTTKMERTGYLKL